MSQSFVISGVVTIWDHGEFTLAGNVIGDPLPPTPPVTPPAVVGDQIDLSQAVMTGQSPDVRGWPIGANLTQLSITPAVVDGPPNVTNMDVAFSKMNGPGAWPIVIGAEGEIQYTLWVGCKIGGVWHFAGSILCISRGVGDNYVPTGPTMRVGQLPNNWYYFAGNPLASYQPQVGEPVAWFLTSGVQRRTDIHTTYDKDGKVLTDVAERTQVVLAPFSPGVYTW